jgi:hypothetical protein
MNKKDISVCNVKTCKLNWTVENEFVDLYKCSVCRGFICNACFKVRSWKNGSGYDEHIEKHCSLNCYLHHNPT